MTHRNNFNTSSISRKERPLINRIGDKKSYVDGGASIEGFNPASEMRTGYQTSEQYVHELSMSVQDLRTGGGAASEENFGEFSDQIFTSGM